MRKRRILITGASGLLGLNAAVEAAKEHDVFGQVNHNSVKPSIFSVVQFDLLVPGAIERMLEKTQPDWVIHCAAIANLDDCETNPDLARKMNIEVPRLLASFVSNGGARLLYVSTDSVFDGRLGEYTEQDQPNPLGIYAQTKLEAEGAVLGCNPGAIVARVNLFGWSLSGKRSLAEFFFNKLSAGEKCIGFTDVIFCPLLANDLAQIFFKMLDAELSGLFHVVSSQHTSKYAFGRQIAQLFGFNEKLIEPVSFSDAGLIAARSPNLTLRSDKLTKALKQKMPNFSSGLETFFLQYQQGYPQFLQELSSKKQV